MENDDSSSGRYSDYDTHSLGESSDRLSDQTNFDDEGLDDMSIAAKYEELFGIQGRIQGHIFSSAPITSDFSSLPLYGAFEAWNSSRHQPEQASTRLQEPEKPKPNVAQTSLHDTQDNGYLLKDSEATKFMSAFATIMVQIPPEMNRETFRERVTMAIGKPIPNDSVANVFVGYRCTEAVGLGCVLPTGDISELMQTLREKTSLEVFLAEKGDTTLLRFFYKEKRVKENRPSIISSSGPSNGSNPKLHSHPSFDKDLVAKRIQEYGGVEKLLIATFDAEFAVVQQGSRPLPIELAVYKEPMNGDDSGFHCFVHPGAIPTLYEHTARVLSTCSQGGGHGIPFRDTTLLRTDYANIAEALRCEVVRPVDKQIILFKGENLTDIDAIRWVFAVSDETTHSTFGDPHIEMFEIHAFAAGLGLDPSMVRTLWDEAQDVPCFACDFHESLRADEDLGKAHCAWRDALRLHWTATQLIALSAKHQSPSPLAADGLTQQ